MSEVPIKANDGAARDQAARWSFGADEQHVIARLECFTDVIFGFVIFMLATNMKVPDNANDLVKQKFEFLIFLCNFAFVAALWWQHHRIFAFYFKPTWASIVIHFLFLGCTALLSYPLQLYLHSAGSAIVIQTYLAGFAFVYFLQTALILLGRWQLRNLLSPERQLRGRVFAAIAGSLGMTALIAFTLTFFVGPVAAGLMSLIPLVVVVARKVSVRTGPRATPPPPETKTA